MGARSSRPLPLLLLVLSSPWPSPQTTAPAPPLVARGAPQAPNVTDDDTLPLMGEAEVSELLRVLQEPEFAFLGPWRTNASFLLEVNTKLARGPYALIENFLDDEVAENLYQELQRLVGYGTFQPRGPAFNSSRERSAAYLSSGSPSARCAALDPSRRERPRSRYSELARSTGALYPKDSPTMGRLLSGFSSDGWARALNMLLVGTGARLPEQSGKDVTLPWFKSYDAGDYMELHNDVNQKERRVLALNYWLSRDWEPQWGGALLWCGHTEDHRTFLRAERLPPAFNRAALFALHAHTLHAVEVVEAGAPARFSFTSWLRTAARFIDLGSHQEALRRRQLAAATALVAPKPPRPRPGEL